MNDLHQLSQAYGTNRIDKDTYRSTRRELIKKICAGEIKLKAHEYQPPLIISTHPVSQPEKNNTIPALPTSTIILSRRIWHSLFSWQTVVICSVIIAVLLAITLFTKLLSPTTEYKPEQNIQLNHIPQWKYMVTEFIKHKNWETNNMQTLLTSWKLRSAEELNDAQNSVEMKRLANAIDQQLLNKQALLSFDDDITQLIAQQQRLVNFSKELEIDDKRLIVIKPTS